jgi:ATP-dependent Lon protease
VLWIATANDASRLPEPILNRMNVYEIEAPDHDASIRIAQSIYREIRNSYDWGRQFPSEPAENVLEKLATRTPREMRRALMSAFGTAKLDGRHELEPGDVQDTRNARKPRIGF